jgi:hypothetical protein
MVEPLDRKLRSFLYIKPRAVQREFRHSNGIGCKIIRRVRARKTGSDVGFFIAMRKSGNPLERIGLILSDLGRG